LSVADLLPLDVGRNVTLTLQFPPTGTSAGQLFVCLNCPGFEPPIVTETIGRTTVPVFAIVTTWAALTVPRAISPNESDVGEADMADLTPVPVSGTCFVPAPSAATTARLALLERRAGNLAEARIAFEKSRYWSIIYDEHLGLKPSEIIERHDSFSQKDSDDFADKWDKNTTKGKGPAYLKHLKQ